MTTVLGDIFDVALIPFGPQVADSTSKDFGSFVCVCVCPVLDSGDLACVVLCCGLHRCSFVLVNGG